MSIERNTTNPAPKTGSFGMDDFIEKLRGSEDPSANAVAGAISVEQYHNDLIDYCTNKTSHHTKHQHLLADIKSLLQQLKTKEKDENGYYPISDELKEKILYYKNEFLPLSEQYLVEGEQNDPLAKRYNKQHPDLRSREDLLKPNQNEQELPLLLLENEQDIDGLVFDIDGMQRSIQNKIQVELMHVEKYTKNKDLILYMHIMIMNRAIEHKRNLVSQQLPRA